VFYRVKILKIESYVIFIAIKIIKRVSFFVCPLCVVWDEAAAAWFMFG
jgi:hypothetical protein